MNELKAIYGIMLLGAIAPFVALFVAYFSDYLTEKIRQWRKK